MTIDSFDDWMAAVDQLVNERAGLSVHDLPDCPFRRWFDDGVSPSGAARQAIHNAHDEGDDDEEDLLDDDDE